MPQTPDDTSAKTPETYPFPFDPTYGYTRETLLKIAPPETPDDFASFWQGLYTQAMAVPPRAVRNLSATTHDAFDVYDIEFSSLGGWRIGGWLTIPRNEPVERGVVMGHGYGGRDQPEFGLPIARAATIFPCARGMSRSRRAGVPDTSNGHVLHGIESRETYIHGGCAADLWCAASALIEMVPEAATRLDYMGGSFGGGIGALAVPWDERFARAYLSVPSFGNHPLRLRIPCVGSGESVRLYWQEHPEAADVLRYFDAATAATFMDRPVHVSAALFDPAVPPPGQFSVYNALAGPKELFVLTAGHFEYPEAAEEGTRLHESLKRFFAPGAD